MPDVVDSLLNAWDKAWNAGDVDALDNILATDYRRRSLLDPRVLDREGMKADIRNVRASFPDLHSTVDQCVEGSDAIAILWRRVGTHRNTYGDVPPTGRWVEISGASFYTIREGSVVEEVETWDPLDMLSVLGIYWLESMRDDKLESMRDDKADNT